MIFGENQVRNFYVVTKSASDSEDRGNAVAVVNPSMKKFFVKYWGPESIVVLWLCFDYIGHRGFEIYP